MYEMEEGGRRSSSAESSGHSSEGDMQRLGETQARQKVRSTNLPAHISAILKDCVEEQGESYTQVHRNSPRHHRRLPRHLLWCIQGFQSQQNTLVGQAGSEDALEWHAHLPANYSANLSRRLPSRLPQSWPQSDPELVHPFRRLAKVYDSSFPFSYIPESFYTRYGPAPRISRHRGQHLLGPRHTEGVLLH